MKVRLLATDSKMPNIALMQISTYHKNRGDDVDWYNPMLDMEDTNHIYESQLFDFTAPFNYYPTNAIITRGGTGIDIKKRLPKEIEMIKILDYSLYPNCDYSMQFYSRGCIRQCPFCVVPDKEGDIQSVSPFMLNPRGNRLEILDNNFFANPNWRDAIQDILSTKQKVNMHGVDVRIMDQEQASALNKMKHKGKIHIAWDFPQMDLKPKLEEITQWIRPYNLMCYVLIGYNSTPEQDLYRVETLRKLKIAPFVMPFNKSDKYQKRFARYVNMKAVFNTVAWEDYNK